MKTAFTMALTMAALFGFVAYGEAAPALAGRKPLIVCFSWSGNTREAANQIRQLTGGDIFEIETVNAYPKEYRATTEQAKRELNDNARPALKVSKLPNLGSYDTVIVAHPNWWGTMPTPVMTLLEANDLSGKRVAELVTHEGSVVGRSGGDLKRLCPKSDILDPTAIRGGSVKDAQRDIENWLREIGILK